MGTSGSFLGPTQPMPLSGIERGLPGLGTFEQRPGVIAHSEALRVHAPQSNLHLRHRPVETVQNKKWNMYGSSFE